MRIPLASEVLHDQQEGAAREAKASLAQIYGNATALLTASGMAAIELALRRSGVGPGDVVVVP